MLIEYFPIISRALVFFFGIFLHHGSQKNLVLIVQRFFWGKRSAKVIMFKSSCFEGKKSNMPSCLDNGFLFVAITRQDFFKNIFYCLTFSQILLIPLVDDCHSTCVKNLKKKP
jgi:hypothetical protein